MASNASSHESDDHLRFFFQKTVKLKKTHKMADVTILYFSLSPFFFYNKSSRITEKLSDSLTNSNFQNPREFFFSKKKKSFSL